MTTRHREASKKKKGQIIEEYMGLSGCTRHHAAWLLRCWGTTFCDRHDGQLVKIVVGQHGRRRQTHRVYDAQTVAALRKLWRHFGYLCGKRVAAALRLWLPNYESWDERIRRRIALTPGIRAKLHISPATIDRLLRAEKRKLMPRGRSHTKPTGTLLLQIPIRTFSEWQDGAVGTMGLDLVGHAGGSAAGEFAYTLLATYRRTQWTEMRAVPNRAQKWVFQQLLVVRARLPFDLQGIHSDGGSEFINNHLLRYCQQHHLAFTRSRAYRKNDITSPSRRTSTWCASTSATPATIPAKPSSYSTSSTIGCAWWSTSCARARSSPRRPAAARASRAGTIVCRRPSSGCWPASSCPRRPSSGCANSSLPSTRSR